MVKRRSKRRSGEEVSKILEEVRSRVEKGESLNSACKEMGIFPSLYYYHKNEQDKKSEAEPTRVEASQPETPKDSPVSVSNAELELLKIKAQLFDRGITL